MGIFLSQLLVFREPLHFTNENQPGPVLFQDGLVSPGARGPALLLETGPNGQ